MSIRSARLAAVSLALSLTAVAASTADLHIAMRNDPDVLDPTLAPTPNQEFCSEKPRLNFRVLSEE